MTLLIVIATLAGGVLVVEITLRVVFGLGSPLLWTADPEIEYLQQPSRSYRRFGRRIAFNSWSMRSREFPEHKTDPEELRVLFVGDSIINGGALTDQAKIATTLLEQRLAETLQRPVVVGNVSAHSWGPPNYLAYLKRYGLFDADVVVIVTNSADHADAPTFEPLDHRRPTRRPWLALQEVWSKYMPLLVWRLRGRRRMRRQRSAEDVEQCSEALRQIVAMARAAGAGVLLAQHLGRAELDDGPDPGFAVIGDVVRAVGVEPISLGPAFADAVRRGLEPYADGMHTNTLGQKLIADTLEGPVRETLPIASPSHA